jgi:hypothetical protein
LHGCESFAVVIFLGTPHLHGDWHNFHSKDHGICVYREKSLNCRPGLGGLHTPSLWTGTVQVLLFRCLAKGCMPPRLLSKQVGAFHILCDPLNITLSSSALLPIHILYISFPPSRNVRNVWGLPRRFPVLSHLVHTVYLPSPLLSLCSACTCACACVCAPVCLHMSVCVSICLSRHKGHPNNVSS